MNRRSFIAGILSLPAAALAARVMPQVATGSVDLSSKSDLSSKQLWIFISNPYINESWARRKFIESAEFLSFKAKHLNIWVDVDEYSVDEPTGTYTFAADDAGKAISYWQ
jgi:hypothetical protein